MLCTMREGIWCEGHSSKDDTSPLTTRVFALESVIALGCEWEQLLGRRGKEPRFVLIDIKLTRVYPYGDNGSDVLVDQSLVLLPRFLVCQNFCVLIAAWGCSPNKAN